MRIALFSGMKVQYSPRKEAIENRDIVRGGYLEKDGKLEP
jgi:hypothetical protein